MAIDLRRVAVDTANLMYANHVSDEERVRISLHAQWASEVAREHDRVTDDFRRQVLNGNWGITPDADDWVEVSGTNVAYFSSTPDTHSVIGTFDTLAVAGWGALYGETDEHILAGSSTTSPCGKSTCPCGSKRVQT